jgi:hypothetical protein
MRTYRRHFLGADWGISFGLGVALVLVVRWQLGDDAVRGVLDGNRGTFYSALASVGGSLLGFAMALVPLVQGLLAFEGLRVVRESRHSTALFKAQMHAVLGLALLTVVSFVALLVDRDKPGEPFVWMQYGVFVALLMGTWKLISAMQLMWKALLLALESHRLGLDEPDLVTTR